MIFDERPLSEALGMMLAHAVLINGKRMPKGSIVDQALADQAKRAGIERLWVAGAEPGDVEEAVAATRIARRLAGDGIEVRPPVHGRVNLHAAVSGLLLSATQSVSSANHLSESVGISVLPPHTPVEKGAIVGTIKIMPFFLPAAELQRVEEAISTALALRPWRAGLSAVLLQTCNAATSPTLISKGREVTVRRLTSLGIVMDYAPPIDHAVAPLATALAAASAPLVLVAGAAATADRRDVIPSAIVAAGGELLRVGMPVDPGNLLVLGRIGEKTVIGLPGCARSPRRNGFDLLLEQWAAGLELSADMIAGMGVGGLLEEGGRSVPWGWG